MLTVKDLPIDTKVIPTNEFANFGGGLLVGKVICHLSDPDKVVVEWIEGGKYHLGHAQDMKVADLELYESVMADFATITEKVKSATALLQDANHLAFTHRLFLQACDKEFAMPGLLTEINQAGWSVSRRTDVGAMLETARAYRGNK